MSRIAGWLAAATLALGLGACVPEFQNAMEGGNAADPALIGTWSAKSADDDQAMLLEVTAQGDGVAVVLRDPSGGAEKLAFTGHTAAANGVSYISLTPVDSEAAGAGDVKVGYMIFRYRAEDAGFKVWALDGEIIGKAIESGKLKGTVTGSGTDTTPKVTATSAELAAYFATPEGQAAFADDEPGDTLILTRVKP